MGIKCIKDVSNVEKIIENLQSLAEKKLEIGIHASAGSKLLKIANAHEFGAHITPNNGKYLSIPLDEKYKNVSPRSIEGLFVFRSKNGNLFLAKNKKRKRKKIKDAPADGLELCYWLTKEIDIPERSFIRAGFDENESNIKEKGAGSLYSFVNGEISLEVFLKTLGEYGTGKIKSYLIDLKSPANSSLTLKVKGSSNPLVDDGHLRDAISYKVK